MLLQIPLQPGQAAVPLLWQALQFTTVAVWTAAHPLTASGVIVLLFPLVFTISVFELSFVFNFSILQDLEAVSDHSPWFETTRPPMQMASS